MNIGRTWSTDGVTHFEDLSEEFFNLMQGNGVGSVAQGLVRIGVELQEHPVGASGDRSIMSQWAARSVTPRGSTGPPPKLE